MFRKPVAYISAYNSVLVCHSEENRIGIYDAKTLKFRSWLQHPDTRNGSHFEFPSSFLILSNGHFFILEKNQINILNRNFAPYQKAIIGNFLSLKHTPQNYIITTQLERGS